MSGPYAVVKEMDAEAAALQVVCLDMKENRIKVVDEHLATISENLKRTNADGVCILSVMGTFRTGKSFLLGLLMRYLRCWERSAATAVMKTEKHAEAFRRAEMDARIGEGKSP